MIISSFRRSILVLAPLLVLLQQGGAAAAPETATRLGDLDLDLEVSLVREGAGAKAYYAAVDGSTLEVDEVTVQAGTRIGELLRSRSIKPNGDALSVVYLLNPGVRDVGELAAGTSLMVPALAGDRTAPGELVQLSLEPQAKRRLKSMSPQIAGLAAELRGLPGEGVGAPGERDAVLAALDQVMSYLGKVNVVLEEGAAPFSPELLDQSIDGAEIVRSILDRAVQAGGRLGASEQQAVIDVARDMSLKARNFNVLLRSRPPSTRWRDVRVVVAVVQPPRQAPVPGLRVFYAPQALVDEPSAVRSFPELSPQVAKRLIEADYVFWAASPGSSEPVTERVREEIRRNPLDHDGEIKLQLSVLAR